MTAQIVPGANVAPRPADRRLAGLGTLVRKDLTEWLRGWRTWVVLAVSVPFMTLTAANGWITSRIAAALPPGAEVPPPASLVPMDNLLASVGAQIFVLATIFAVGSLVVAERQSGILAWVASKPVSRRAIWFAKWASSTAMLAVSAVIVPFAVTVGLVVALYGAVPVGVIVGLAFGMVALVAFFAAVGLTAGTIVPGQPAVIAVGFVVFALTPVLAGIMPFDISPFLPTSILPWFAGVASGAPVSFVTPVAFAVATAAVVGLGLWRMDRLEL
jgi:ABC-type transport system involved in multi-copper enzyme maturation permease subunit